MGSTAIAFLSGKGGSGKTTLALSIADLLCRCDVRILLVDCDLSTNGATYFYESKLADCSQEEKLWLYSFNELLNLEHYEGVEPLKIRANLDFIPSIAGISEQYLGQKAVLHNCDNTIQLQAFLDWARCNYDVILFDCQAGYTQLLSALLPLMDIDLFVLEADSISASAMRSLHLKIGNVLGHARLYQVFNKATQEEFEIYSKIVGTFFTNIGTLLFDWKIRQAFSRSQIPDLENTSAQYGLDLCNICKIILFDNAVQKKLEQFSNKLRLQRLEEEHRKLEGQLYKLAPKSLRFYKFTSIISLSMFTLIYIFVVNDFRIMLWKSKIVEIISLVMILVTLLVLCVMLLASELKNNREKRREYEIKLKDIDKEIEKLNRLQKEQTSNQLDK